MLRYWTAWNFTWYLGSELGFTKLNGPLRTSIINTAIIGGFMTFVYPRKIVLKIRETNEHGDIIYKPLKLPYYQVVLLDLVFHQLPLARLMCKDTEAGTCGFYSLAPVAGWFFYLGYRRIDMDKIYGIKMLYLSSGSALLTLLLGYVCHNKLLKFQ